MSLIEMTLKHGRTIDEARGVLEKSVNDVCSRFGAMIERVEWSPDRNTVSMSGSGCHAEIRVDNYEVHVRGDIPFLSGLLGAPIMAGFKQIIQSNFKQLTPPKSPGATPHPSR